MSDPIRKVKAHALREKFNQLHRERDDINGQIEGLLQKHMPGYYFLDYTPEAKVGFYWKCDKSPVGICVFKIHFDEHTGRTSIGGCAFCGDPRERK